MAGVTTAGIRLEIPEFLRPSLRALESTSILLKQNNPHLKRNIKYDDDVMDLVMDVRLTPISQWKKIRPDQASEAKKGRATPSREDSLELDSGAIQAMLSESASTSSSSGANATPMGP